jgi:hypothetical protein
METDVDPDKSDVDPEKSIVETITEAVTETVTETAKAVMADVKAIAAEVTEAVGNSDSKAPLSGQVSADASGVAPVAHPPAADPDGKYPRGVKSTGKKGRRGSTGT